jgi:metal-sulfur cluster biosynthetic enzyme
MDTAITREHAIDALKTVFDPEIPVNVWDLGLIYELGVTDDTVAIRMTLTAPGCPVGPQIAAEIEEKLRALGARDVSVSFVWTPPWTVQRVTPEGKMHLQTLGIPV